MLDSHRDLLDALFRCIVTDEGFAREVAEIAERCERDGNHAVAAAMRNISRNHRIRGMESRANLAAVQQQHAGSSAGEMG